MLIPKINSYDLVFPFLIIIAVCFFTFFWLALQEDTRKADIKRIAEDLGMTVIDNSNECKCYNCVCSIEQKE